MLTENHTFLIQQTDILTALTQLRSYGQVINIDD